MDDIANHFPAQNALRWVILHIQSQHIFPQKRPRCLDPNTNIR